MKQELNTVRPSSAHRWMKCAYSAFAEGLLPRSSSPAAEIGTRTHAVAAQRLYTALKAAFPNADISDFVTTTETQDLVVCTDKKSNK